MGVRRRIQNEFESRSLLYETVNLEYIQFKRKSVKIKLKKSCHE